MSTYPTEDDLRRQVRVMIALGVKQRYIAGRIGVHESWVGRWLEGADADQPTRAMTVPMMNKLQAYVTEFLGKLQETQRPALRASTAGREFQSATKPPRRRAESDDRERHA